MAQKERGALGMWWGCICKREYFKIKEYFMQDCMMYSENAEFSTATARNREVQGSEGQSFDSC